MKVRQKMFEAVGLVFFAGVVYLFLIVVPAVVENLTSEEFRCAYFKHLAKPHVNSFGR